MDSFEGNLPRRRRQGIAWRLVFQASTVIGIVVLSALLYNVINQSFGLAALEYEIDPASLAVDGVPLEELSQEQLVQIFQANVSAGLYRRYDFEVPLADRPRQEIYDLVQERVLEPRVIVTWTLFETLFEREAIEAELLQKYPGAQLEFLSWLNPEFVQRPQSSEALRAGVRTAILGSLWVISITLIFAFPIATGAAI
ncbi:MAG: hypothetical protein QGM45_11845, partial [Anaerolineales bacterium]|nr:hypothetical protein [Anaerolineales bacterium]